MKPWYKSKTVILNGSAVVAAALADYLPGAAGEASAPMVALVLGVLNVVLRFLTAEPVSVRRAGRCTGLAVCLLALASCASTGGGAGVVASVVVGAPSAKPDALVRYDGNALVAWGSSAYTAEMFIQAGGLPLMLRTGAAGKAIARVRSTDFQWEGPADGTLPAEVRVLFRDAEVAIWGLTFVDSAVAP